MALPGPVQRIQNKDGSHSGTPVWIVMEIINNDIPDLFADHSVRYAGRFVAQLTDPFHEVYRALHVTHTFCLLDVGRACTKSACCRRRSGRREFQWPPASRLTPRSSQLGSCRFPRSRHKVVLEPPSRLDPHDCGNHLLSSGRNRRLSEITQRQKLA